MRLHVIVCLVLVAGVRTCHSKPTFSRSKKDEEQSVTSEPSNNPIDLGILESCRIPAEGEMGVCGKFVDYSVPSTLLNPLTLSNTLLYASTAYSQTSSLQQVDGYDSDKCAEAQLKYLCGVYFPKCDSSTNQLLAEFSFDSCFQEITSKCSPTMGGQLFNDGICLINSTTVSAAKCRPSSEYELKSEKGFCSAAVAGWSDVYLTDLMHVQLQQAEDLILNYKNGFSFLLSKSAADVCTQAFARMTCESVGKCWDQGKRAEMSATREDCEFFWGW